MLTKENFSLQHIMELKSSSKRDPALLERVIYAFGLLEALRRVELPFIFKGGTSLLLLLDKPRRLSTDIDIIVNPEIEIEEYLGKASKIFPFKAFEEQISKGSNHIEKRHFKFQFDSPRAGEPVEIFLDVLFEHSKYANVVEKEIDCELLLTEPEYLTIKVPDVNSILADKMTAFAPHTTGVLLHSQKDLEIMKQMYDVYSLIEVFTDFDIVCDTYKKVVADEIAYRGLDITDKDVLMDTYRASLSIASRGIIDKDDYQFYLKGIRSLTGHVYALDYSAEVASVYAPLIMYMSACMWEGVPFEKIYDYEEYIKRQHIDNNVAKALKSLRKRNPLAYAYSIKADEIMNR